MKTKEAKRMINIATMMFVVMVMMVFVIELAFLLGHFNYYITMFTLIAAMETTIIAWVINDTYSEDLYFTEEA